MTDFHDYLSAETMTNIVEHQDIEVQTDAYLPPIFQEAQLAIREYQSMKFANSMMLESMIHNQKKARDEINKLKEDVN